MYQDNNLGLRSVSCALDDEQSNVTSPCQDLFVKLKQWAKDYRDQKRMATTAVIKIWGKDYTPFLLRFNLNTCLNIRNTTNKFLKTAGNIGPVSRPEYHFRSHVTPFASWSSPGVLIVANLHRRRSSLRREGKKLHPAPHMWFERRKKSSQYMIS